MQLLFTEKNENECKFMQSGAWLWISRYFTMWLTGALEQALDANR